MNIDATNQNNYLKKKSISSNKHKSLEVNIGLMQLLNSEHAKEYIIK